MSGREASGQPLPISGVGKACLVALVAGKKNVVHYVLFSLGLFPVIDVRPLVLQILQQFSFSSGRLKDMQLLLPFGSGISQLGAKKGMVPLQFDFVLVCAQQMCGLRAAGEIISASLRRDHPGFFDLADFVLEC